MNWTWTWANRKTRNLSGEKISCPAVWESYTSRAIIMFSFFFFCVSYSPLDFIISYMRFLFIISYTIVSVIVCIRKRLLTLRLLFLHSECVLLRFFFVRFLRFSVFHSKLLSSPPSFSLCLEKLLSFFLLFLPFLFVTESSFFFVAKSSFSSFSSFFLFCFSLKSPFLLFALASFPLYSKEHLFSV